VIESPWHFRNLVARIVEHHLRDQHDWFTAARRAVGREARMPSETTLPAADPGPTPSRAAVQSESQRWLRLALHFLDPDDRRTIMLREWEGCSFEEIGRRLGTTAEAARKRFTRALPRLLAELARLKREVLEEPYP
jgi:RNA polymerase sigma factor (sigma-70 family)